MQTITFKREILSEMNTNIGKEKRDRGLDYFNIFGLGLTQILVFCRLHCLQICVTLTHHYQIKRKKNEAERRQYLGVTCW